MQNNDLSKNTSKSTESALIYGIYPGAFIGDIEKLDDANLWMIINELGYSLWWQNHTESDGRAPHVDMSEYQYAQEYLVHRLCQKLDIEVSEPTLGMHIRPSTDYMKWFRFYDSHFKNLSDKEMDDLQEIINSEGDISKYLPNGSWRD